jgi:WD40 repeat protein
LRAKAIVSRNRFWAYNSTVEAPEFNGAADPIVRVDARRLRDKLREYYASSTAHRVVISLPKGSYVPVFDDVPSRSVTDGEEAPVPARGAVRPLRRWWVAGGAASLLIALASLLAWPVLHHPARARLIRVTTFQGNKLAPALSPDGRFLAFSSKGPEDSGRADIWIKAVDGESLRRLTQTPDYAETSPAWSPDGHEIAFVRPGHGVFVVSQAGDSPERRISASGTWVDWASDGKSVLIRDREGDAPYAIYQVFPDRSERRRLTQPLSRDGDWRFSVSPDGTRLAFIRNEPDHADIYIVPG